MTEGISRRKFLQSAAIAAGSATVAMGLAGCAAPKTDAAAGKEEPAKSATQSTRPAPGQRNMPLPMTTGETGPQAMPIEPVEVPESWDEEYEFVVVGSGGGGLVSTSYLASEGAKVCLVEKSATLGGATKHAADFMCIAGGSKVHEEAGYFWPQGSTEFNLQKAVAEYQKYCQYTLDNELIKSTILGTADFADWLMAQPRFKDFMVCHGMSLVDEEVYAGSLGVVLGNTRVIETLETNAKEKGAEIKVTTECAGFVRDGERVVGIVAKVANSDKPLYLKASKAVIACAGGFGFNMDMTQKYTPTAYMWAVQGGPFPSHSGDVTRMALGMGADMAGFNSFSCWEGGLDEYWGNGDGEYFHYFWDGAKQTIQNPWLMIDKSGNRLPYYLSDFGIDVRTGEPTPQPAQPGFDLENYTMGDLASAAAWMSSIGHRAYCLFDSNYKQSLLKFSETVLVLDKSRVPLGLIPESSVIIDNPFVDLNWEQDFQEAVDRGAISKADTWEELAEMLGLEPERVTAAVKSWNELCARGVDDEMAVPYLPDWLIPLNKPPFYGAAEGGVIAKTLCGVRVNGNMNVLTPEGTPIPGLYAGATTAGGFSGENNFGGQFGNCTINGSAGISAATGFIAARAALRDE